MCRVLENRPVCPRVWMGAYQSVGCPATCRSIHQSTQNQAIHPITSIPHPPTHTYRFFMWTVRGTDYKVTRADFEERDKVGRVWVVHMYMCVCVVWV